MKRVRNNIQADDNNTNANWIKYRIEKVDMILEC
jgi:hypothetical protein